MGKVLEGKPDSRLKKLIPKLVIRKIINRKDKLEEAKNLLLATIYLTKETFGFSSTTL